MSNVMVMHPILGALMKSEDVLGSQRVWRAVNESQSRFLEDFFSKRGELSHFSKKEMRAWASWVASELNAILAREGFSIRLKDLADGEFGVVSILDVIVEWRAEGSIGLIRVGKEKYPAVHMDPVIATETFPVAVFHAYLSSAHDYPMVVLYTKSGDRLYMSIADESYSGFELVSRVDTIRNSLTTFRPASWLMFPMTDLNLETDLGWLVGMKTTVGESQREAIISQALQQTKFKMNQLGARVKSAVAMGVMTTSARLEIVEPIIINKPFFLWIERPGMSFPLMYAYVDEANWKNPGDLSDM